LPEAQRVFSTFLAGLKITGLDTFLTRNKQFTIFAPTDTAFAKLPKQLLDAFIFDRDALAELISGHILEGIITTKDIKAMNVRVLFSDRNFKEHRGAIYIENTRITFPDLASEFGIVHGISRVLLPNPKHHTSVIKRMLTYPHATSRR
jgi:uncharacterized surface protein with fasciclin (FAS1) repeats